MRCFLLEAERRNNLRTCGAPFLKKGLPARLGNHHLTSLAILRSLPRRLRAGRLDRFAYFVDITNPDIRLGERNPNARRCKCLENRDRQIGTDPYCLGNVIEFDKDVEREIDA